jgi:hypothetical protein
MYVVNVFTTHVITTHGFTMFQCTRALTFEKKIQGGKSENGRH